MTPAVSFTFFFRRIMDILLREESKYHKTNVTSFRQFCSEGVDQDMILKQIITEKVNSFKFKYVLCRCRNFTTLTCFLVKYLY